MITAGGATYQLAPADDPVLCSACAIARWLEVLNIAARQFATVAIAQHLREADRVTLDSPHSCCQSVDIDPQARAEPLLAPIDQWGAFLSRCNGSGRRPRWSPSQNFEKCTTPEQAALRVIAGKPPSSTVRVPRDSTATTSNCRT